MNTTEMVLDIQMKAAFVGLQKMLKNVEKKEMYISNSEMKEEMKKIVNDIYTDGLRIYKIFDKNITKHNLINNFRNIRLSDIDNLRKGKYIDFTKQCMFDVFTNVLSFLHNDNIIGYNTGYKLHNELINITDYR